jgi:hypothetical protein
MNDTPSGMSNMLSIFKDDDSRMAEHAGKDRVFFHSQCTGQYSSYGPDKVSTFFVEDINPDHLLERMVSLMHYLQEGYHTGEYPGPAGEYDGAEKEYPLRYLSLVSGLSDEALEIIKDTKMSGWTTQLPDDLGEIFYEQMQEDKRELNVSPDLRGGSIDPQKAIERNPGIRKL